MKYLLSVAALLLLCSPAQGQEFFTVFDSGQLKDIGAVHVIVDLPSESESLGLLTGDIQRDSELKLRTAGIAVETLEQAAERGTPYLYVNVNTVCNDVCAYKVGISYRRTVMGNNGTAPYFVSGASVWETEGITGTIESGRLREVRDDAKTLIDEFINAYLAANPK